MMWCDNCDGNVCKVMSGRCKAEEKDTKLQLATGEFIEIMIATVERRRRGRVSYYEDTMSGQMRAMEDDRAY